MSSVLAPAMTVGMILKDTVVDVLEGRVSLRDIAYELKYSMPTIRITPPNAGSIRDSVQTVVDRVTPTAAAVRDSMQKVVSRMSAKAPMTSTDIELVSPYNPDNDWVIL
jgi:hypothetical protein